MNPELKRLPVNSHAEFGISKCSAPTPPGVDLPQRGFQTGRRQWFDGHNRISIASSRNACGSPDGNPQHFNPIAGTRRLRLRRGQSIARSRSCTAPSGSGEAQLLQVGAGVAVDLGAKPDLDDLRGFPTHTLFLLGYYRVAS